MFSAWRNGWPGTHGFGPPNTLLGAAALEFALVAASAATSFLAVKPTSFLCKQYFSFSVSNIFL
jgi:hypothetical protein